MGLGRDQECYTLPMVDPGGEVVGIRKRHASGRKNCVTRSRLGLFIPANVNIDKIIFITESESDLAALLALGFEGIARPGCRNCFDMADQWCKQQNVQHIVIVGDSDKPGRDGAGQLAELLIKSIKTVRVLIPSGAKDIREQINNGIRRENIISAVKALPVRERPLVTRIWKRHITYNGPFRPISVTAGA